VLVPGTLALLVGFSAWVIAAHPQQPVWDQQALLASRIGGPAAPAPATGFTSQLIVALLQPLLPDAPAARDAALRTLAMVLYLGSAAWLAARLFARRASAVVLLLLVTTSQYPFLWLSSELFTGALLMAALAAWASAAPPALAGALLALFGLCKPDAILPALALLAYWAARAPDRREALRLAGAFAGTLLLLLLPGTLTAGLGYFTTYGGAGGRTFASFGQHYAALAAGFQVGETVPNPWTETGAYVSRHVPGATGLGDVVLGHFPRYAEFVALACVRGLFRAGYVANYAALAVPILLFAGWRARLGWGDRERALLLAFVGVAPFVLFAYPHVRYLARYYPLFVLLLLLFMERLGASRDAVRRPALLAAGACLACSLVENALRLAAALARGAQTVVYWFPD
jgi:hypothetical protein